MSSAKGANLMPVAICRRWQQLLLLLAMIAAAAILPAANALLGDGSLCFPILRSAKVKKNDVLMAELKSVVNDPSVELAETSLGRTKLADPDFLQKLAERQFEMIRILGKNLVKNIPKYREVLEEVHQRELEEIVEGDTCQSPQAEAVQGEQPEGSSTGTENGGDNNDGQREDRSYSPLLDVGVWRNGEQRRTDSFMGRLSSFWRRHTMYDARKTRKLVKGLRDTGLKQFKRKWRGGKRLRALLGLFTYYSNPWHCQGLQRSLKYFASFFQSPKKKRADKYRRQGTLLFKLFCKLNLIDYYRLERLDVDEHIRSPAKLDDDIAALEKFSLDAFLMPFRQSALFHSRADVPYEHLQLINAVLTEERLLEALLERLKERTKVEEEKKMRDQMEAKAMCPEETVPGSGKADRLWEKRVIGGGDISSPEGTDPPPPPARGRRWRRKRVALTVVGLSGGAVAPSMSFAGVSLGAGTVATLTGGIALIILTILGAIYFCNI